MATGLVFLDRLPYGYRYLSKWRHLLLTTVYRTLDICLTLGKFTYSSSESILKYLLHEIEELGRIFLFFFIWTLLIYKVCLDQAQGIFTALTLYLFSHGG